MNKSENRKEVYLTFRKPTRDLEMVGVQFGERGAATISTGNAVSPAHGGFV